MTVSMIDVVHQGSIAIVTLRRPPANAMSLELTEEIAGVFQGLGQARSVRSVVLTGQGKSFCAGVDLKTVPNFDEAHQRRMVDALNRAFYAVYSCPVPVVGAINGHAIAGGLVLALCCDWRIAVKTEFLTGLTEVRVGVPYPVGAIEVVRQELRPDVARRLVLFGRSPVLRISNRRPIGGQTSNHSLRTASLALSSAGVPSNTMRPWPMT